MSKKLLLDVQGIDLGFPISRIRNNSLRDAVISVLKKPLNVFKEPEVFHALKNINFKAHAGERIGILGVNGAGKSTLCRCISGFYTAPTGNIVRNGKVRALFESSLALFPELSGRENLHLMAAIFYDPKELDVEKIIEESIEFSELGGFIDAPVKTYSKGMLLRLTLSLLSATPTDILILDEVFDGADEFFREKLASRIRNLIDKSGVVIFVSHQDHHLIEVCNRVLLMNSGTIVFDGSPEGALVHYRKHYSDVGHRKLVD